MNFNIARIHWLKQVFKNLFSKIFLLLSVSLLVVSKSQKYFSTPFHIVKQQTQISPWERLQAIILTNCGCNQLTVKNNNALLGPECFYCIILNVQQSLTHLKKDELAISERFKVSKCMESTFLLDLFCYGNVKQYIKRKKSQNNVKTEKISQRSRKKSSRSIKKWISNISNSK